MRKTHSLLTFMVGLLYLHLCPVFAHTPPFELMPTLPVEVRDAHFAQVSHSFDERWTRFSEGREFSLWKPGRPESEILNEYQAVDLARRRVWFVDPHASPLISKPEYKVAQDLLGNGYFRNLNTLAFDYNKTDSSYNSSSIVIDGFKFLALEGPKPEHIPNFFRLLLNHHVTHLVRLTPAYEGKIQKTAPYWYGKVSQGPEKGIELLHIDQSTQGGTPSYSIPYYAMDDWMDHQDGEPKKLLELVMRVKSTFPSNGLLACHCSSGVSRTGTFLAAFLLLNEMDKQIQNGKNIEISVEKTVLKLSLQRVHAVGKERQYLTLYRILDLYYKAQTKGHALLN